MFVTKNILNGSNQLIQPIHLLVFHLQCMCNNTSCQYDAMFSSYCTYLFIYIYTTKQNVTLTAINHFFQKCCMLCFDGTPFMICLCVVSIDQEDISGLMMNILIMQTIRPIIAFYFIFLFMLIRHSSSNKMNIQGHAILFRSKLLF